MLVCVGLSHTHAWPLPPPPPPHTHQGDVIVPSSMTILQPVHLCKVIQHTHHITLTEQMELRDRACDCHVTVI